MNLVTMVNREMKILLLSPFHGGSHQAWAEGLTVHCRAEFELLSLPDRFWKWRMHGGSVALADRFNRSSFLPDLILATDMLDLAVFLALTREKTRGVPAVLYMHENQLTYPMVSSPEGNRTPGKVSETDHHYPFINLTSMMAADRVLFNSAYHRDEFLAALPGYLRQFPDFRLERAPASIKRKSSVINPGIKPGKAGPGGSSPDEPPLVLWNQRMEYDKNPGEFFAALSELKREGYEFRLAVCGEQYSRTPDEVERHLDFLEAETVHRGYLDREKYDEFLREADLVFSTAIHEFFGISILEAILNRTYPVLPDRLSYPELIPREFHGSCLYRTREQMLSLLRKALRDPAEARKTAAALGDSIGNRFSWKTLARQYEDFFADTCHNRTHRK